MHHDYLEMGLEAEVGFEYSFSYGMVERWRTFIIQLEQYNNKINFKSMLPKSTPKLYEKYWEITLSCHVLPSF